MPEESARIGDIDIAYETFGSPGDPAMLLVMGLAHPDDRLARRLLRASWRATATS